MPDSKPLRIAKQFQTQAQQITAANGYNTNAGLHVDLGRTYVSAETDTFPRICILWEGRLATTVADEHREVLAVTVTGFVKLPTQQNDNEAADALFQDIRKAILVWQPPAGVDKITPVGFGSAQPDADSIIARSWMVYDAYYFDTYGG